MAEFVCVLLDSAVLFQTRTFSSSCSHLFHRFEFLVTFLMHNSHPRFFEAHGSAYCFLVVESVCLLEAY